MSEEEKQALTSLCKIEINRWKAASESNPNMRYMVELMEIALAALTAQPVKLPKGFNPGIGDIFDKAAPVMRRDATDGKWLHKADVTKILNELGYEVQE